MLTLDFIGQINSHIDLCMSNPEVAEEMKRQRDLERKFVQKMSQIFQVRNATEFERIIHFVIRNGDLW